MTSPSNVSRETFQQFLASAFAVQQSQISRQCLSDIMDLQRSIASGKLDLDGAMNHVVASARDIANASGVAIALLKGDRLTYRAGTGTSAALVGRHVTASLTGSARTDANREILRVEDAQTDRRVVASICRQFDAHALLILPIYHEGAVAGVFQILFSAAHAFQEDEVCTFRLMAEQIEAALHHVAEIEREQTLASRPNFSSSRYDFSVPQATIAPQPAPQPASFNAAQEISDADLDDEIAATPAFGMLPENEHSLYARCGAVFAAMAELPGFRHSFLLASAIKQRAQTISWPKRAPNTTPTAPRTSPTFARAALLAGSVRQRAHSFVQSDRWRKPAPRAAKGLRTAFDRSALLAATFAQSTTQRAKNISWPDRLRLPVSAPAMRSWLNRTWTNRPRLNRSWVSRLSINRSSVNRLSINPSWLNRSNIRSWFDRQTINAGRIVQRTKGFSVPARWRTLALPAVAGVLVLSFAELIAYGHRSMTQPIESSALSKSAPADSQAPVPKPLPATGSPALQTAATPAKDVKRPALKRVRVSANEVDYIADDVTIRTFDSDKPTIKRARASDGRVAHIGNDVTVRYFTPTPTPTRAAAR